MARSLLDKLKSLEQSVRARTVPEEPMPATFVNQFAQSPVSGAQSLLLAGFEQVDTPYGACWRRQTAIDLLTRHGERVFAEILNADFAVLANLVGTTFSVSQLRFYDVETNGLGTGAGTFPFLHTIGSVQADELCLTQFLVDDYDAEAAVLFSLGEEHLQDDTVIVTFNGKSFDWPLLQNRRLLHRLPPLQRPQLDLLHPSRRLWRHQLSRVTLANVESHVLGFQRVNDLPGSEAPTRYFRYLETKDVDEIAPVLQHNAMDVCSLVVLQVVITCLLNGETVPTSAATHVALASWYDAWDNVQAAGAAYQNAVAAADADWHAHFKYGLFLKRYADAAEAADWWRIAAERFPKHVEPLVELAKCYEHRLRLLSEAEMAVEEALRRIVNTTNSLLLPHRVGVSLEGPPDSPLEAALKHRLQRIKQKQARQSH